MHCISKDLHMLKFIIPLTASIIEETTPVKSDFTADGTLVSYGVYWVDTVPVTVYSCEREFIVLAPAL